MNGLVISFFISSSLDIHPTATSFNRICLCKEGLSSQVNGHFQACRTHSLIITDTNHKHYVLVYFYIHAHYFTTNILVLKILCQPYKSLHSWSVGKNASESSFSNSEIKSIHSLNLKTIGNSGGKEELRSNCSFQLFTETYWNPINVKTKC